MEETIQNPAENNINPPVNPNGYGGASQEQLNQFVARAAVPGETGPVSMPDAFRSEAQTSGVDQSEIKFGSDLPAGKVQAVKDAMVNQGQNEPVSMQTEEPQPLEQGLGNSGKELILGPDNEVKKNWSEPSANPFFTNPKPPTTP